MSTFPADGRPWALASELPSPQAPAQQLGGRQSYLYNSGPRGAQSLPGALRRGPGGSDARGQTGSYTESSESGGFAKGSHLGAVGPCVVTIHQ